MIIFDVLAVGEQKINDAALIYRETLRARQTAGVETVDPETADPVRPAGEGERLRDGAPRGPVFTVLLDPETLRVETQFYNPDTGQVVYRIPSFVEETGQPSRDELPPEIRADRLV